MKKLILKCPDCGFASTPTIHLKEGEIVSWEDISPTTVCKCGKKLEIPAGEYEYEDGSLFQIITP